MEQSDLVRHAAESLEKAGIRYFVTGSTASIYYGEPRFTNDVDIVVDLEFDHIDALCRAFPEEEFYLSRDTVDRAVMTSGQFNVIHPTSGLKIAFLVAASTSYNQSRFARAVRLPFTEDVDVWFASMEDVIIKKLEYYQMGESDKHLRDIAGILALNGDDVDMDYIRRWTRALNLGDDLDEFLQRLSSGRACASKR